VRRANRPNTWLHRPACKREEKPCQLGAVHTWHMEAPERDGQGEGFSEATLDAVAKALNRFETYQPELRQLNGDRGFRYEAPDVRHFCLLKAAIGRREFGDAASPCSVDPLSERSSNLAKRIRKVRPVARGPHLSGEEAAPPGDTAGRHSGHSANVEGVPT
jgi:hypothetical protein